jgi:hypothetical protein
LTYFDYNTSLWKYCHFFPLKIFDLILESRTYKYHIVKPASGILLILTISLSVFSSMFIRNNICESLRIKDGSLEGCDYRSRRDSVP